MTVKFKRFIYVGLGLGVGLVGGYLAWQQHVQAFLERVRPPSVDQVKKWAGFPENTHLTMFTNVPDEVAHNTIDDSIGKVKWFWTYEDRKGSNYTHVVVAVFEPGGFWPSKRALLINASKQIYKRYSEQKHSDKENAVAKEGEDLARELSPMTMPDGQKSYGFLFGLAPARFAHHPEFDVMACTYCEPMSYDERYPPADLTAVGTNPCSVFFTNVDAFLTSQ